MVNFFIGNCFFGISMFVQSCELKNSSPEQVDYLIVSPVTEGGLNEQEDILEVYSRNSCNVKRVESVPVCGKGNGKILELKTSMESCLIPQKKETKTGAGFG